MTLPCVCFIQSGRIGEEPPHKATPERFQAFKEYLRALRVQEGASIPTEDEYEQAFDLLETAFPWPHK